MTRKLVTAARPRSGRISAAVAYSGIGRSSLYILAGKHRGLFRKNGSAVIVDFDVLDEVIATLPLADIKTNDPIRSEPPTHR